MKEREQKFFRMYEKAKKYKSLWEESQEQLQGLREEC